MASLKYVSSLPMSGMITKSAISALQWSYLGLLARSGTNFVIGIFLARLLGPKPFGQVAAASLVISIANLLADGGFTSALVQATELSEVQIRYVFTVQCLIASSLTFTCIAISGIVASSFHDVAIKDVLRVLSPLFIIQAIGQTSNAILRRSLSFRTLQISQILSYLIGYVLVGIPLAFVGAGVWSLVAAQLTQSTLYSIQLYLQVRHPMTPTLHPTGAILLRFGAKVTAMNLTNWGISNTDNVVVGSVFGSLSLGLYSRAFSLASAPCDAIVGTLQQILFASCSRAEGRLDPIRRAYLTCLSGTAAFIFPSFWAMSACATTVMVGLYGEKWRAAGLLFQPLVFALSIHAVMAIAGPILGSLNLVEREIRAQMVTLLTALIVFAITARYSPLVLSWGVCCIYMFRFIAVTRPTLKVLGLTWAHLGRALIGPSVLGLTAAAILSGIDIECRHMAFRPSRTILILLFVGGAIVAPTIMLFRRYLVSPDIDEILGNISGLPRMLQRIIVRAGGRPTGTTFVDSAD